MVSRTVLLSLLALLALSGCRALTEPGLRPDAPDPPRILEGQVLAPDGTPLSDGEIVFDNRQYEPEEEDWVQTPVALDAQGRFQVPLRIGERTDVVLVAPDWSDLPDYRVLGVQTSQLPWTLRHAMVEVELPVELPDSFAASIVDAHLRLVQSRPRPAGAPPYNENYEIPVDTTSTARGWALAGAHDLTFEATTDAGNSIHVFFADSLEVVGESVTSIRPSLVLRSVEVVLPELPVDVPRLPQLQLQLHGAGTESGPSWTGFSSLSLLADQRWIRGIAPPEVRWYSIRGVGFVSFARVESGSMQAVFGQPLDPIRWGTAWLQVVLPSDLALPERHRITLDPIFEYPSSVRADGNGRAMFLLDPGAYLIEVRVDTSPSPNRELVHRQVVEVTESRTLYLDF